MTIKQTKGITRGTYQSALPGDLAAQLKILQNMASAKDPPMQVDFMVWSTYKDEYSIEVTPMFFSRINESTLAKLRHMVEVVERTLGKENAPIHD